ncbi:hypothetical protein ACR71G_10855 [Xenorhabdus bovienii]|uniref:hypothetical protein n=1 Tax=Xenorhabdus bovienii TaxID=40576 RepID=UPI003DA43751
MISGQAEKRHCTYRLANITARHASEVGTRCDTPKTKRALYAIWIDSENIKIPILIIVYSLSEILNGVKTHEKYTFWLCLFRHRGSQCGMGTPWYVSGVVQ